tara:strand:- start:1658 stop:2011 length:354 start_codon:yes stop_codon:yes gene_type:complete
MGRNFRNLPVVYAADVTAVTAAPSAATDGVEYPNVDATECYVLVSGADASKTIDITPYWYDPKSGNSNKWVEGNAATITGSGVMLVYCVGTRLYLRVTAIAGSSDFDISVQFVSKGA